MTRTLAPFLALPLAACASLPDAAAPLPADANPAAASAALGFDILALQPDGETQLLSPFSISTAFGLVYIGSKGQTQLELRDVLRFGPEDDSFAAALGGLQQQIERDTDDAVVDVNNAVFKASQLTYRPDYLPRVRAAYDAGLESLDFFNDREGATDRINAWVKDRTRGLIEQVYADPLAKETADVLVNTIYMKAAWPGEMGIKTRRFTGSDGARDVPYVIDTAAFRRLEGSGYAALSLPFADPELSAVFILPDAGVPLSAVEGAMAESGLPDLLSELAVADYQDTIFEAPKLSIRSQYALVDTLKALGASDPFDRNRANFTGRLQSGPESGFLGNIVINNVIHKTVLDLDEIGVEAAAVTAIDSVIVTGGRIGPPPVPFIVDRPFLLVLTHVPTGAPLFLARVTDPGKVGG